MSDDRASYYERIRRQLLALVIELEDRLTPDQQKWAHEYLDANELGLALEMIADCSRMVRGPSPLRIGTRWLLQSSRR